MQNKVTTVVDSEGQRVTEVALKPYVVVATFARSVVVTAVNADAALRSVEADELSMSNDDSMNLLNWNAYPYEAD